MRKADASTSAFLLQQLGQIARHAGPGLAGLIQTAFVLIRGVVISIEDFTFDNARLGRG